MKKENIYNIPNMLSFYRLLSFPFVLWMMLAGEEKLFAVFLCVNLVTDVLDGLIARVFKLQTEFGARLDSLADNGTYILAISGILFFKMNEMQEDLYLLWIFLVIFLLANTVSLLKFKKWPSLHLYTTKIGGYAQGIFFFVLFMWGYNDMLFYIAMALGYISWIEELIILLLLKEMKSDAQGLYWILKSKDA